MCSVFDICQVMTKIFTSALEAFASPMDVDDDDEDGLKYVSLCSSLVQPYDGLLSSRSPTKKVRHASPHTPVHKYKNLFLLDKAHNVFLDKEATEYDDEDDDEDHPEQVESSQRRSIGDNEDEDEDDENAAAHKACEVNVVKACKLYVLLAASVVLSNNIAASSRARYPVPRSWKSFRRTPSTLLLSRAMRLVRSFCKFIVLLYFLAHGLSGSSPTSPPISTISFKVVRTRRPSSTMV